MSQYSTPMNNNSYRPLQGNAIAQSKIQKQPNNEVIVQHLEPPHIHSYEPHITKSERSIPMKQAPQVKSVNESKQKHQIPLDEESDEQARTEKTVEAHLPDHIRAYQEASKLQQRDSEIIRSIQNQDMYDESSHDDEGQNYVGESDMYEGSEYSKQSSTRMNDEQQRKFEELRLKYLEKEARVKGEPNEYDDDFEVSV
ncbi:hypothetical protein FGO68_gene17335 [Halteria grandinella]|uniref:Uncharacterized protein n=1 Tax=Halteria grandinella TaxID=5974 RepID=A0A8J8NBJ5_HALGN|nr:hypothetical protein FGO68_gene17335 [Halteria grandinella]